jgi:hypothetical protein
MQSFSQFTLIGSIVDKVDHCVKLVFGTSFKSARVVENVALVAPEHELILNVVLAALQ